MKLNVKKPRNFINPLLSRKSVDEADFKDFQTNFDNYKLKLQEQIKSKQIEDNIVTNVLKPFMDSLSYKAENYSQKGQISIDLALMKGITPTVIIEAKMPNSNDMITEKDLNKKSFHQAILYFMNEKAKNNKELYHIIVTDFNNWFVFDAKDFDRLFWNNKRIRKYHEALINETLLGDRTEDFYRDVEKELPTLKRDLFEPELIDCAHFNIQLEPSERQLTAIYKLLSPDCLSKGFNPNDANSLNKEFYNELLYILGLEETKDGGKKVIGRSKKTQSGTLYENISNKLAQYQKPNDFESVIKLIIIWVNRILFLKLLESQIVKWAGVPKFLEANELSQYDQLETLFFDVLAKPNALRSVSEYKDVPYLNSSLFEIHQDEKTGITIATMADDLEIDYYSKTVLKQNKNETGKISTLPYLLSFLDAYDFANDSDDELTNTSKTLINASVLGLIFEKVNGYKDGSFYTPSFITMYMARETIEKTVVEKFNRTKGWKCKTLKDVVNKDYELDEANAIINDIKVCDPAVGSGHFLVSALNELLRIKSDLRLLTDENGERIKDCFLSVENDELIIMSDEGEQFEYKKGSKDKTRIQKTLFKEKQTLIERCLFGVDINPNSVNICRLRLWVELLKNAYYKENGELDTLPNIDINIKSGNSLISRFGLNDELDSKTIKNEIKEYKDKVHQYKENVGSKQEVLQAIETIKNKFKQTLKSSHETTKKLNNSLVQFVSKFGLDGLSSHQKLKAIDELKLLGKQHSLFEDAVSKTDKDKYLKAVATAWVAVEEVENGQIYQDAFEWRFEFPEVLNDVGDFVGFDAVVGNPPYGVSIKQKNLRDYLTEHLGKVPDYEIYYMFVNLGVKLLAPTSISSLLIPNTMLFNVYAENFRLNLLDELEVVEVVDCTAFKLFDDATVSNIILTVRNRLGTALGYKNTKGCESLSDLTLRPRLELNYELVRNNNSNWGLLFKLDQPVLDVVQVIKKDSVQLSVLFPEVSQGLIAYDAHRGQSKEFIKSRPLHSQFKTTKANKQWLKGEDVTPYNVCWSGKDFFEYSDRVANGRIPKFFKGRRVLIREITNPSIYCGYTDIEMYHDPALIVILESESLHLFVLLAILNSQLATFFHFNSSPKATKGAFPKVLVKDIVNFPLPLKISDSKQSLVVETVEKVLHAKQESMDTTQLEKSLDTMVCELYGLTENEVLVIEEFCH